MEVKGTAVKSIMDFVKYNFKEQYQEWFSSLSSESQVIFNKVLSNGWYPIKEAILEPTQRIADMFYDGDECKGAWECGMYSAEIALNGIYKIYVRFSSPSHVVDRGSRILPAYYNPIKIDQIERKKNFSKFEIKKCDGLHKIIEYRIAGWMYKALDVSGCKKKEIIVSETIDTHGRTIFDCSWD